MRIIFVNFEIIKIGDTIINRKYCYNCGSLLETQEIDGRLRKICPECKTVNYQNPVPSVAVILTDENNRLLLTKRAAEPGIGLWCLPGGFIEMGETPSETVVRETKEETGLDIVPVNVIDAQAKINGFHGDVVIIGYLGRIIDGELKPGDDAEEVEYFAIDNLPQLAFRSHIKFIEKHFNIEINTLDLGL